MYRPDFVYSAHWSRRFEYPWLIEQMGGIGAFQKDWKVLDIGCADNPFQFLVASSINEYYAIDVSQEFLDASKQLAINFGISNIKHENVDATKILPYPDDFFDFAYSISTIEHMPPPFIPCIEEMIRVTKPGGKIIITMDVADFDQYPYVISQDVAKDVCNHFNILYPDESLNVLKSTQSKNGKVVSPGVTLNTGVRVILPIKVLCICLEK
jgi:ubiquinone/menaquinone biosynthesis C-methylase UbiE